MRIRTLIPLAACALAAVACSQKPDVKLAAAGSEPLGSFDPTLALVPVGIVVGFTAQVKGSANETAALVATVDDNSKAYVLGATNGGQFMLVGLSPGQTTLHIWLNDVETNTVPVDVTAQPLPTGPSRGTYSYGTPWVQCANGPPECTSAESCSTGQLCCALDDGSASPITACVAAPCPPTAQGYPVEYCGSSAECVDGGICEPEGVIGSGIMVCGSEDAGNDTRGATDGADSTTQAIDAASGTLDSGLDAPDGLGISE
jgi:hypothetical protein